MSKTPPTMPVIDRNAPSNPAEVTDNALGVVVGALFLGIALSCIAGLIFGMMGAFIVLLFASLTICAGIAAAIWSVLENMWYRVRHGYYYPHKR